MPQFRWITPALAGQWCLTRSEALCDAVASGQAVLSPDTDDLIVLLRFATIEQRSPDPGCSDEAIVTG